MRSSAYIQYMTPTFPPSKATYNAYGFGKELLPTATPVAWALVIKLPMHHASQAPQGPPYPGFCSTWAWRARWGQECVGLPPPCLRHQSCLSLVLSEPRGHTCWGPGAEIGCLGTDTCMGRGEELHVRRAPAAPSFPFLAASCFFPPHCPWIVGLCQSTVHPSFLCV